MELIRTQCFHRGYRKLGTRQREGMKKALAQLLADRAHPGLRVKRVRGTDRIWELRAGRSIRVTFEIETGAHILRNVGHHDPTLSKP